MTSRLVTSALAHVLDLDESVLRADTPLEGIGADCVALVQWADVILAHGAVLEIPDRVLVEARTVGDLDRWIVASSVGDTASAGLHR